MSRVDLEVEGEKVAEAHFSSPSDVVIALEGGDREVFELANWEHLVVKVEDDPVGGEEGEE